MFHHSARYHMMFRWKGLRGKRRDLELSVEPSDTPVSTVPHGVPMEGVKRREAGLRAECGAL